MKYREYEDGTREDANKPPSICKDGIGYRIIYDPPVQIFEFSKVLRPNSWVERTFRTALQKPWHCVQVGGRRAGLWTRAQFMQKLVIAEFYGWL
jgi:hypothetical protein